MSGDNVLELTEAQWDAEVIKCDTPVVVDFWAPWCGPCKMIAPILDDLAEEYSGLIKFVKVNVDDYPVLASRFNVRAIPTLLVIKHGVVQEQSTGLMSKDDLKMKLDNQLE